MGTWNGNHNAPLWQDVKITYHFGSSVQMVMAWYRVIGDALWQWKQMTQDKGLMCPLMNRQLIRRNNSFIRGGAATWRQEEKANQNTHLGIPTFTDNLTKYGLVMLIKEQQSVIKMSNHLFDLVPFLMRT